MLFDLNSVTTQVQVVLKAILPAQLPEAFPPIPTKIDPKTFLANSKLQRIPFDEKIPDEKNLTGKPVTHSDASEIDSFKLKNGQRIFATIPDKANPSRLNLYDRNENGRMEIRRVIPLLNEKGLSYEDGSIDTEAIRFFQKDGKTFAVITSEGESRGHDKAKDKNTSKEDSLKITAEERKRNPKVYLAELIIENGEPTKLQVQKEIATPERYRHQVEVDPNDPKKTKDIKGPRANGSFESIAVSPDGKRAFLITEFPLVEDGDMATTKSESLARCLEIDLESGSTKEYAYKIDRVIPSAKAQELIDQKHKIANEENGVVSIVNDPFNKDAYFVAERSFLRITDKDNPANTLFAENSIRIYRVTKDERTTEVSNKESLKDGDFTPIKKELYLDFKNLNELFSKEGIDADTNKPVSVDNYEGMTLFYNVAEKCWEAIFITDNNSNKKIQGGTQVLSVQLKNDLTAGRFDAPNAEFLKVLRRDGFIPRDDLTEVFIEELIKNLGRKELEEKGGVTLKRWEEVFPAAKQENN